MAILLGVAYGTLRFHPRPFMIPLGLCVAKVVWHRLGQALVALCEALRRRLFSWLPARFTP
ncbi:hypothetical protein [Klebsiella aerogenes]|uniref:hypothetical protein n=1 Tax=Klebsiella aerogenes TaxID=548 RepID=UPI001F5B70AF|nr:hypothetical protein [Klebsiella aerogenes]